LLDTLFDMFNYTPIWVLFLSIFIGYGLGSIPFGLLLTKAAGIKNLTKIGSGNIGATNVLRTGRKDLAAATLIFDMLKGTLAVYLVQSVGSPLAVLLAGLGAFLGHLYPVWLSFKGGKGVATFLGVALGLYWPAALAFAVIWLAIAYLSRFSSLAALCASVTVPLILMVTNQSQSSLLFMILTCLLWWKHWPNLLRLMSDQEPKIGKSKP
jgi:acyl phosphate:glycerol-3-phosphate acyltransferase